MDIKDKNEKILELLESIEDLKVQVYSRDKSIELQQGQISQLMEDLREAKQFEHQCKALQIINNSLEQEKARLQVEVNKRLELAVEAEIAQDSKKIEEEVATEQVTKLEEKLEQKVKETTEKESKLRMLEKSMKQKLLDAQKDAEDSKRIAKDREQERDAVQKALSRANKTKA